VIKRGKATGKRRRDRLTEEERERERERDIKYE
jgi:hypothetical protein